MLTPSTRATIRPRSLSTSVIPSTQARSLVYQGWRSPRNAAYESHSDPLYPRLNRHHTIKARAKLARSVRRRQQFDWDTDVKPITGPKHVRLASHWNGKYGSKWSRYNENPDNQDKNEVGTEGHELNEREKAWKEQLDNMRKRIESDPYEAIFGKRFEPFWNPFLRQWMSDDTGESTKDLNGSTTKPNSKGNGEKPIPSSQSRRQPETPKADGTQQVNKPTQNYAHSSSASWDSKTNKAKKSEWDSISGETKHYEYDPVSNRMVLVQALQKGTGQQQKPEVAANVTWKPSVSQRATRKEPANSVDVEVHTKRLENKKSPVASGSEQLRESKDGLQPADPAKSQEVELDALTAEDVRASMGRTKHQCFDPSEATEEWKTEQESLRQQVKAWDDSMTKLRNEVTAIVDNVSATKLGRYLPTTLDRRATAPKQIQKSSVLQPAVQRMQSKAEPEPTDLDDSAAHESTETIAQPLVMPKGWSEQADILQSDRVKRTTSQRPYPTMRWLDDMNARKTAYEKERALADAELARTNAKEIARLEKLNEMLAADVDAQKLAMSEQQDRSAGKIRSLRSELETAYKQSSIHADAFRERILTLEKELSVAQNTANDVSVKAIKERYGDKIRGLKNELEIAYKQSSVHADEFTQRIRTLEAELSHLTNMAGGVSPKITSNQSSKSTQASPTKVTQQALSKNDATTVQGEGDFSPNVVKFAGSDKWYKQSSTPPQPTAEQIAKAEQKLRDEELVKEVRSIYENTYGTINAEHKQPTTPKDPALEEALAKHDKRAKYGYKDDKIGEQIAAEARGSIENPSVQERVLFGYKIDGSEAKSTRTQSKIETKREGQQQSARKADAKEGYAFKADNLGSELKDQSKPADAPRDGKEYAYKPDDLEAELRSISKTKDADKAEKRYAFKPDDLEAQLKKQSKSTDANKDGERYVYKPDDLEAELQSQSKFKDAAEAEKEYPFKPDDLEAQLQSQSKFSPMKSSRFQPDGLEAELRRQSEEKPEYESDKYEAEAAKITSGSRPISKGEKAMAASLGHDDFLLPENESAKPAVNESNSAVKWQNPPLYKIIAYDAGNDRFSDATTTAWDPSLQESPISISQALSQLYQPARWTKYFASLQREGFQVVHAREDVLVLKKVDQPKKAAKAHAVPQTDVNPVDGTSRPGHDVHTATGDYASPTGFVNFDPVKDGSVSQSTINGPHTYDRNSAARALKEEPINAMPQQQQAPSSRALRKQRAREFRRRRLEDDESDSSRSSRFGKGLAWMLGVGGVSATLAYAAGSVAEQAELARREREMKSFPGGLEREAEERRMRWRLDEGIWKKGS